MLNREPMWLKCRGPRRAGRQASVSVLNREPMWLKFTTRLGGFTDSEKFQCSTVSRCG